MAYKMYKDIWDEYIMSHSIATEDSRLIATWESRVEQARVWMISFPFTKLNRTQGQLSE